jgi:hypothetical protein
MTDLRNNKTVELDFGAPPELRPWPPIDPVLRAAIEELAPRMFAETGQPETWLEIGWGRRVEFRKWVKGWLEARAKRDSEAECDVLQLPRAP